MLTVLRDYFAINRVSIAKDYAIVYLGFLACVFALLMQKAVIEDGVPVLFIGIFAAVYLALSLAVLILLLVVLDAYVRIRRLAREAGVPISEYVKTEDYRRRRQEALKRPDKKIKWL